MGRGPKPVKGKTKPAVARKSRTNEDAKVRHLEKRLAEALRDKAEAQEQLQTRDRELGEAREQLTAAHAQVTEVLEQQGATAEILRVISSSPTDVQPVFDTVVQTAGVVCGAVDAVLWTIDGDELVVRAHHGPLPATIGARQPIRGSVAGHAVREARIVHVEDLTEADDFPVGREIARRLGWRTTLSAPLLREGVAIGAVLIRRSEVRPFTDKQIALLKTFADQAVIAIENVRLFNETKEALEQQTATSEILRVIASSPTDVQPIFDAIVESALRLCDGLYSSVFRIEGDLVHAVAHNRLSPESLRMFEQSWPVPVQSAGSLICRAIRDRAVVHVSDIEGDATVPEPSRERSRVIGQRSLLAVPMLRDGIPIGAIRVSRHEPKPFSQTQIELLKTFADQAVIAIENVRLFTELQEKNQALTEALERQTATSEILRVISSSPTDVQPVFDTIIRSAATLCGATFGNVQRFDGEFMHLVAHYSHSPEWLTSMQQLYPRRPDRTQLASRAVLSRGVVHVADVLEDPEYQRDLALTGGFRGLVSVPMLRNGEPIGVITVAFPEPKPFANAQIELLKTFAAQAVIAIENVRLFNELEASNREIADKSRQIEVASQHKSEFLANMSHELRTPLNAIIGFSEVLTERMFGELNEKQDEYLKDIHASGQHLLSLINDILDLSKIEAGRMELELTDFHLPTALDNALTLIRERAGRRSITLQMSVDERLGEVRADERKVRQVVLNLLSNAIKFTPEGGRIEVAAVPKDGSAEVSVSDTGVGIAPEDQEAVFEEFRQVGAAEKKVEGTGLGLTLCRKFVELHGGRIWVKSQEGVGSTFTFTIPVRHGE
jgi:two-component system, NtrC family, sensor kinase